MAYRKRCFRVSGNSILESVIALSIISVCLFIALLVYASVFSQKTSPRFYNSRNQTDELFFLMQVQDDSLANGDDENIIVEEEFLNANLKKVTVKRKDSIQAVAEKSYYIYTND